MTPNRNKKLTTAVIWAVLILLCLVFLSANRLGAQPDYITYSRFLEDVQQRAVSRVQIDNNEIAVDTFDGRRYHTLGVVDDGLIQKLSDGGARISWGPTANVFRSLLIIGLPILLLLAFLVYFLRKSRAANASIFSLGKSRARLIEGKTSITFADVGGCDDAKELLGDVVDFLIHPQRWAAAGVRLPRGVLLEGPPGCGKTLLARAVAGETDAKFYVVSASEFVELFVGVGAARVRDTFETAAKNAPAVIFIDELDAVGRRRGSGVGAGHDEREQTLNQLLVCLDGFEKQESVVVIAATNRSDILDPALLRPGRFDRRIEIPKLDAAARRQIIEIHSRNKCFADDKLLDELVRLSDGMTGAQIEALLNEAALLACRRGRTSNQSAVVRRSDVLKACGQEDVPTAAFDSVDVTLIESVTQIAKPTGTAHVRIHLHDFSSIEGEIIWADAAFIKLRTDGDGDVVVSKMRINSLESLDRTTLADDQHLAVDRWALQSPGLA